MTGPTASEVVRGLRALEQHDELAALVRDAAVAAADARDRSFARPGSARVAAEIPQALATDTPFGNVRDLMARGAETHADRRLLGALLALGVRKDLPSAPETELPLAARLVWLAAHTPCDAFEAADEALGTAAGALWQAVASIAARPEKGGGDFSRHEALVAAAVLRRSGSDTSSRAAQTALGSAEDSLVAVVLREPVSDEPTRLTGEMAPAPKNAPLTALLTLTLILPIAALGRELGRLVLAYRRPASVRLGERGLELEQRTELLGRVLRERNVVVPLDALARVTREVRYARAGLYAGLLALVLGSYMGVALFVDGLRVPGGSAPLLGLAVLVIVVGVLLDFGLSTLSDSSRGRCRIVIVPRRGRALCVGALDATRVDRMLTALAKRAPAQPPTRN